MMRHGGQPPTSPPSRAIFVRPLLLLLLLLLPFLSACSTLPRHPVIATDELHALRTLPAPTHSDHSRSDHAVLDTFFASYGVTLSTADLNDLIPAAYPPGRISAPVLRRIAKAHGLLPAAVRADPDTLWDALGRGEILLLALPAHDAHAPPSLAIPVAWDRADDAISLLVPSPPPDDPDAIEDWVDVPGSFLTLPSAIFFRRRAPLRHASIRLATPRDFARDAPTDAASRLLLADYWADAGKFGKANAIYSSLTNSPSPALAAQGLLGQANLLASQQKFADAVPLYEQALALDPDNPRLHNNLAYALLRAGGPLLTALRHARFARDADPTNPIYLETLGALHLALGDPAQAAKTLEYAWSCSLRHPESVQVAIQDQLARAWLAADNELLAWQVASYRVRYHPTFRIPKDLLRAFPALRKVAAGATPPAIGLPSPPTAP